MESKKNRIPNFKQSILMLCIMIDKEGRVWKINDSGLNQELFQRKIEIPERLGIHCASLIFFPFQYLQTYLFKSYWTGLRGRAWKRINFQIMQDEQQSNDFCVAELSAMLMHFSHRSLAQIFIMQIGLIESQFRKQNAKKDVLLYQTIQLIIEKVDLNGACHQFMCLVIIPAYNIKSIMVKQTKREKKASEDQENCSICTIRTVNCKTVECSHQFCYRCLSKWLRHGGKCPLCRQAVKKTLYKKKEIINEMETPLEQDNGLALGEFNLGSLAWLSQNPLFAHSTFMARMRHQYANKIFFYPFVPFFPQPL